MTTLTARQQRVLLVLFVLFSISLALSKSAVNIVMTLIYLAAVIFSIRSKGYRQALSSRLYQPLVLPLLLCVLVAGIGVWYTEYIADGLGILNKITGLLLVYWMTSALVDTTWRGEERSRIVQDLVLAFIIGIMALDLIGLLTFAGVVGNRKLSLPLYPMHVHHIWFGNLNALGIYAACSFLLFGELPPTSRKRPLLIAFLALAAVSILLSISRTAWLGIVATGIILLSLYTPRKRILVAALAVTAAGSVLAYTFIPLVHDRINAGFSDIAMYAAGNRESSMGWRFLMWQASLAMFLSDPVFGVGTGDYVLTMERFIGSGAYPESLLQFNQPHNMYLFALATNGAVGLCTLLFLFYWIFRSARPGMREGGKAGFYAFIAIAAGIHYLIGGLNDSFFNIQILRTAFAFLLGICLRSTAGVQIAAKPGA